MRFLSVIFLLSFTIITAVAQEEKGKFTSENIKESEVPEAVKSSQSSYYQGIKINQWKKNTLITKKGDTFVRYVAWFKHNNKQLARAEYEENGKGKYGIVYYGEPGLPQVIKDAAMKAHPDMKINAGQYVKILSSGKEGYKVVQQKGFKKLVSWLDTEGKELSKEYVAEAYKDLWGINQ